MNLVLSRDIISYLLDAVVRPVVDDRSKFQNELFIIKYILLLDVRPPVDVVALTIFGPKILLNNKKLTETNL
jgi:hypothetical protein